MDFGFRHSDLQKYGTIRKISNSKSQNSKSKTIIHIQDVHLNQEAQANIGKALQELISHQKADLIALEGAFEDINLSPFYMFPRQESVKKAADFLLKENKISGPIHAALMAKPNRVAGVDDRLHYNANVEAYRRSAALQKKNKKRLALLEERLETRKLRLLNPRLADFDRQVKAYQRGHLALGQYVRALLSRDSVPADGQISIFLKALDLETSLRFSEMETQREKLLSHLIPQLSQEQTKQLTQYSVYHRLGRLDHVDFYGELMRLCEVKNISLDQFPEVNKYLRYMRLSESLDAEKLMGEIKRRETDLYQRLAKIEREKELIAESRKIYLMGKLLDFALTKEEWEEYRTSFLVRRTSSKENNSTIENLSSFESFYLEAEIRDQTMAQNLINELQRTKNEVRRTKNVSILVTGGFHSKGIADKLTEAGLTVITFVPKITKVDTANGSAYLSAFSREKTPLEKLFEGEKLFLARDPGPKSILKNTLPQLILADQQRLSPKDIPDEDETLLHRELSNDEKEIIRFSKAVKRSEGNIQVNTVYEKANVQLDVRFGKDGELLSYRERVWIRAEDGLILALSLLSAALSSFWLPLAGFIAFVGLHLGNMRTHYIKFKVDQWPRPAQALWFISYAGSLIAGSAALFLMIALPVFVLSQFPDPFLLGFSIYWLYKVSKWHIRLDIRAIRSLMDATPTFPWVWAPLIAIGEKAPFNLALSLNEERDQLNRYLRIINVPNIPYCRIEKVEEYDVAERRFSEPKKYRGTASVVLPGSATQEPEIIRSRLVEAATAEGVERAALHELRLKLQQKNVIYPTNEPLSFPFPIYGEEFTVALHQLAIYLRWEMPVFKIFKDSQDRVEKVRAIIPGTGKSLSSKEIYFEDPQDIPPTDVLLKHLNAASYDLLLKIMKTFPQLGERKVYVWANPDGSLDYKGALMREKEIHGHQLMADPRPKILEKSPKGKYSQKIKLIAANGKTYGGRYYGNDPTEPWDKAAQEIAEQLELDTPPNIPLPKEPRKINLQVNEPLSIVLGKDGKTGEKIEFGIQIKQYNAHGQQIKIAHTKTREEKLANLLQHLAVVADPMTEVRIEKMDLSAITKLKRFARQKKFANMPDIHTVRSSPYIDRSASVPFLDYDLFEVSAVLDAAEQSAPISSGPCIADDPGKAVAKAATLLLEKLRTTYADLPTSASIQHPFSYPQYLIPVRGAHYKLALDDLCKKVGWKKPVYEFTADLKGQIRSTSVLVEIPTGKEEHSVREEIRSLPVLGADEDAAALEMLMELTDRFGSKFFEEDDKRETRKRKLLFFNRDAGKSDYLSFLLDWATEEKYTLNTHTRILEGQDLPYEARVEIVRKTKKGPFSKKGMSHTERGASFEDALNKAAENLIEDLAYEVKDSEDFDKNDFLLDRLEGPDLPSEKEETLKDNYTNPPSPIWYHVEKSLPFMRPVKAHRDARVLPATHLDLKDGDVVDPQSIPTTTLEFMQNALRYSNGRSLVLIGLPVLHLCQGSTKTGFFNLTASAPLLPEEKAEFVNAETPIDLNAVSLSFLHTERFIANERGRGITERTERFRQSLDLKTTVPFSYRWGRFNGIGVEYDNDNAISERGDLWLATSMLSIFAIGMTMEGVIVDPCGGLEDLRNEVARFVGTPKFNVHNVINAFQAKHVFGLKRWDESSRQVLKKLATQLKDRAANGPLEAHIKTSLTNQIKNLFEAVEDPVAVYEDMAEFGFIEPLNKLLGDGFVETLRDSRFYELVSVDSEMVQGFVVHYNHQAELNGSWDIRLIPTPYGSKAPVISDDLDEFLRHEDPRDVSLSWKFQPSESFSTPEYVVTVHIHGDGNRETKGSIKRPRRRQQFGREDDDAGFSIKKYRDKDASRMRKRWAQQKKKTKNRNEKVPARNSRVGQFRYIYDSLRNQYVPPEMLVPVRLEPAVKIAAQSEPVKTKELMLSISGKRKALRRRFRKLQKTRQDTPDALKYIFEDEPQLPSGDEIEAEIINILNGKYKDPTTGEEKKYVTVNKEGQLELNRFGDKGSTSLIGHRFLVLYVMDQLANMTREAAQLGVSEIAYRMALQTVLLLVVESGMNPAHRLTKNLVTLAETGMHYLLMVILRGIKEKRFVLSLRRGGLFVDLLTANPEQNPPDLLDAIALRDRHIVVGLSNYEMETFARSSQEMKFHKGKALVDIKGLSPEEAKQLDFTTLKDLLTEAAHQSEYANEALGYYNQIIDEFSPKAKLEAAAYPLASSLPYHLLSIFFRPTMFLKVLGIALVVFESKGIFWILQAITGWLTQIDSVLDVLALVSITAFFYLFSKLVLEAHAALAKRSKDPNLFRAPPARARLGHLRILALYILALPFIEIVPEIVSVVLFLHIAIDTNRLFFKGRLFTVVKSQFRKVYIGLVTWMQSHGQEVSPPARQPMAHSIVLNLLILILSMLPFQWARRLEKWKTTLRLIGLAGVLVVEYPLLVELGGVSSIFNRPFYIALVFLFDLFLIAVVQSVRGTPVARRSFFRIRVFFLILWYAFVIPYLFDVFSNYSEFYYLFFTIFSLPHLFMDTLLLFPTLAQTLFGRRRKVYYAPLQIDEVSVPFNADGMLRSLFGYLVNGDMDDYLGRKKEAEPDQKKDPVKLPDEEDPVDPEHALAESRAVEEIERQDKLEKEMIACKEEFKQAQLDLKGNRLVGGKSSAGFKAALKKFRIAKTNFFLKKLELVEAKRRHEKLKKMHHMYIDAQEHFVRVKRLIAEKYGYQVRDEIEKSLFIKMVYLPTRRLYSDLTGQFQFGIVRNSRFRNLVYIPLRYWAVLKEKDYEMAAFSLVYALRKWKKIEELNGPNGPKTPADYGKALREFDREQNKERKKYLTWGFRWRNVVDFAHDQVALFWELRNLSRDFKNLRAAATEMEKVISEALHSFVDPQTGRLKRLQAIQVYDQYRAQFKPIQDRFNDLTMRAVRLGDYHMVLELARWRLYGIVLDSGIYPIPLIRGIITSYIRTLRYPENREFLETLKTGEMPIIPPGEGPLSLKRYTVAFKKLMSAFRGDNKWSGLIETIKYLFKGPKPVIIDLDGTIAQNFASMVFPVDGKNSPFIEDIERTMVRHARFIGAEVEGPAKRPRQHKKIDKYTVARARKYLTRHPIPRPDTQTILIAKRHVLRELNRVARALIEKSAARPIPPEVGRGSIETHAFDKAGVWKGDWGFWLGFAVHFGISLLTFPFWGYSTSFWIAIAILAVIGGRLNQVGFGGLFDKYGDAPMAHHFHTADRNKAIKKARELQLPHPENMHKIPFRRAYVWVHPEFGKSDGSVGWGEAMVLAHEFFKTHGIGMFWMAVQPLVLLVFLAGRFGFFKRMATPAYEQGKTAGRRDAAMLYRMKWGQSVNAAVIKGAPRSYNEFYGPVEAILGPETLSYGKASAAREASEYAQGYEDGYGERTEEFARRLQNHVWPLGVPFNLNQRYQAAGTKLRSV